ncbi:thiol:disulfide interchange protein DsbA [Blochmannia endosymbiont of Polyrhachis (Hedomyrma) turneri]|uniref:thiol:disulfide interchange protein DsbA n=1 Tax=Blochmannia endosymbiont of Polyrhachis (Hedomyrma) turneri TaxID=1505596 RepID=UPI00061A85B3|nr:thiol:disulfide interchange protein DsbA [Blochmannia endosymbiont of Polyrhachis (Hedomyrma) turneri]AKC60174.1 thiol:disulfide interchange protein DsbA [Blochmannia endosymbiont of Polyrhachis (Hedomyrma) turneri]
MKSLFIMMVSIMFLTHVFGTEFYEGQQYISLEKSVHNVPQLLEFFSFYCPHCYQFEEVYHISKNINKTLPKGINIVKYHVDFLGELGKEFTQAWAVAVVLGIEDKMSAAMFSELHKQAIHTIRDIRLLFIKFGVTDEEYDVLWNSVQVKSLVLKQRQAVSNFQLHGVPAIFVNGKYMIRSDGLDTSSMDAYIRECSEVIRVLIFKIIS